MSTRKYLQLLILAGPGLGLGWLALSPPGVSAETGDRLAFEDFEDDKLDPLVRFLGQPPPEVSAAAPLAGTRSALVPCLRSQGDESVILLEPLSKNSLDEGEVEWVGLNAILDLSEPCVKEALVYSPMVLASQGNGLAHVYLRSRAGALEISTSIATDAGQTISSPWSQLDAADLTAGGLVFELQWAAAQGPGSPDGRLSLDPHRQDGSKLLTILLAGVDNDSHRVGQVLFGAIGLPEGHVEPGGLRFDNLTIY